MVASDPGQGRAPEVRARQNLDRYADDTTLPNCGCCSAMLPL
jgi:hypothetical protein